MRGASKTMQTNESVRATCVETMVQYELYEQLWLRNSEVILAGVQQGSVSFKAPGDILSFHLHNRIVPDIIVVLLVRRHVVTSHPAREGPESSLLRVDDGPNVHVLRISFLLSL